MICFVLFPQASQPSMNFNISELVYYGRARPDCISPTLRLYRFLFRPKINQNVWQQIDFQVFICFYYIHTEKYSPKSFVVNFRTQISSSQSEERMIVFTREKMIRPIRIVNDDFHV